jgi:hypothetical protein
MMMEYSKIGMEGERTSKGRPTQVRVLNNIKFESTSDSRILLHQNWRLGHIRSRIWTFYIWLKPEFHWASNDVGPTLKYLLSRQESSIQLGIQNLTRCCVTVFGPLAYVPCWSPLGLRLEDLHAPNSFLFSSHLHLRIWVLLRSILSSNSVAVHRFVRPHLVIKSVWLHLLFLLVFLIALAGISLHGEVIRVTRVITNGAVV